jgi:hypothetical protein
MRMPTDPDAPLPPPPRQAHLRRGVRNLRRAYRSLFTLIVLVLGGWAALDAFRWHELPEHVRYLDIGFGLAALIAVIVWTQVERPQGRELRLGRLGVTASATILTVGKPRGRRFITTITYAFQTAAGATVEGKCRLPRRFPVHRLAAGMTVEVLYDPKKPKLNKPRLAFGHIEFGEMRKRKGPA